MSQGQWRVETTLEHVFTWDYAVQHRALRDLYEKAKREQWNVSVDIDWSPSVEPEGEVLADRQNPHVALLMDSDIWERMTPKERGQLRHETLAWNLSQFLHGEQLAIFVAGQLVASVPWIDAKYYGSTQVVDEARHAEVFAKYLHEKLEREYPLSATTRPVFETILSESQWDIKYLGLQVVLEGLAMGLFSRIHAAAKDPVLKQVVRFVMQDESRHFAFGNLSLRNFYDQMTEKERNEREDFAYHVCELMRGRIFPEVVWEKMGLPVARCREVTQQNARKHSIGQSAFNRVIPALKAIGMLSNRIRPYYEKLGLLKYADHMVEDELPPLVLARK